MGDARSRGFTMNVGREWNGQMQDLKPVESGQEEGFGCLLKNDGESG